MFVPHRFLLLYNSIFSSSFSIRLRNFSVVYAFLATLKNGADSTEGEAQGCRILFMECEYWFKDCSWVMVIFSMHMWINAGFH